MGISDIVPLFNVLKELFHIKRKYKLSVYAKGIDEYDRGNFSKKNNVTIRNVGKNSIVLENIGYLFKNDKGHKVHIDSDTSGNMPEISDALLDVKNKRENLTLKSGDVINVEYYCPYVIKYFFTKANVVYAKDTEGRKYYSKKVINTNLGVKNNENKMNK